MRKQLGIIASLLLLSATAMFWTGCSDSACCNDYPTACESVRTFDCDNGKDCCEAVYKCCHPNSNKLDCIHGIKVHASNPRLCSPGDEYPVKFCIEACDDVCDVVVKTHLPDDVKYVSSTPEATVQGNDIIWNIGSMNCGETIPAVLNLLCVGEGEKCICFCADAIPVRFCSLVCAKPVLTCEKTATEEVCPCDPIYYNIKVSNVGSCAAEQVVVTDRVPDGVVHESCCKELRYELGTICPGDTKEICICMTAVERGTVCNVAEVTSCNAEPTSCRACTCICCCDVEIEKVGPKEVKIGGTADYTITVTNTGDKSLTNVIVTDNAPCQLSIVSANGAEINGNQAVWRMNEIKQGEKVNFNISLTGCVTGSYTNSVDITDAECCNACDSFTTLWRGRPALHVCIADTCDPICIGDPTTYNVEVTNQGTEPDENVVVVLRFPEEITPERAYGHTDGQVSGNTVTFAPSGSLSPGRTIRYAVDARAARSGDGRVVLEVSSDSIATPIMQQESTIVH